QHACPWRPQLEFARVSGDLDWSSCASTEVSIGTSHKGSTALAGASHGCAGMDQ
ncbi:hypothetical protein HAX54_014871, partial [Datura stramonium]|nr:hypothetical protein [Datura stramonium]